MNGNSSYQIRFYLKNTLREELVIDRRFDEGNTLEI